jgi:hypothetical protein
VVVPELVPGGLVPVECLGESLAHKGAVLVAAVCWKCTNSGQLNLCSTSLAATLVQNCFKLEDCFFLEGHIYRRSTNFRGSPYELT